MRNAIILLIFGILQVHATDAYSQKTRLSLNFSEIELIKVLDTIEENSKFFFLYNEKLLDTNRKISITADNQPINIILDNLFAGTDVKYAIIDQKIILAPDYLIKETDKAAIIQQQIVKGKVTDSRTGEAMPGVNIVVKGTNTGITADIDGNYSLPVTDLNDILIFSFIGYITQEIPLNGRTILDIVLVSDMTALDEVMVIGYGTMKKSNLTGSISQVNAVKLENEKPTNVQNILRVNAPGLNVGFDASAKGGATLEVRGRKSLNAGREPLYVVDGIIYFGELSDINPIDIASIDILKDASSTAVFGAKAANGVIVITTKKGKTGKPVINFNNSIGLSTMEVNQPINSAEEHMIWRSDALTSMNNYTQAYKFVDPRNLPSDVTLAEWLAYDNSSGDPLVVWLNRLNFRQVELENYLAGKSINWYDKVFQNGLQQDYNISISNSADKVSYYWSLGYQDNEGIIVGDEYSVIRSRLNLEATVTDFLHVGLNTQFSYRDESSVPVTWTEMVRCTPWGSEFKDDGVTLRYSPQDDPVAYPNTVSENPLLPPAFTDRLKTYYTLNSSLYAKINLPFEITYQLNYTPNFER